MAPGASIDRPGPNRTPEIILTLALARAVTLLVGTNFTAWTLAGSAGRRAGETAAAKSNKGPIIMGMVTKMKRHGYPLVRHCSKMDRLPKRLNPLPA